MDAPEPGSSRGKRQRLRLVAPGMLIGTGIVIIGFVTDRPLVILAGVLVIVAAWWFAAQARIRRQPRR